MNYDSFEVPDGITPLVGYRGWVVKDSLLNSCYRDTFWPIAGPLASECIMPTFRLKQQQPTSDRHYVSPHMDCTCGIYALNDYPRDWEMSEEGPKKVMKPWPLRNDQVVVGMVQAWGKMIVGTKGFRAQYARPIALVAPRRAGQWPQVVEDMAEVYGLEIVDIRKVRHEHR